MMKSLCDRWAARPCLLLLPWVWLTANAQDSGDIERRLRAFVSAVESALPAEEALSDVLRGYVSQCESPCYGATMTLLDADGRATASPYWYRGAEGLAYADLMNMGYHIDEQAWLRAPLDARAPVWSAPYYDEGGGETWMRTYSVPVFSGDRIIAVATTDIEVPAPAEDDVP